MSDGEDILDFWFSERVAPLRFVKDAGFDAEITDRFLHLYENALKGGHDDWQMNARGALALVILLDQFPRNMFRDNKRSFEADDTALTIVKASLVKGYDQELSDELCAFLYVPFMHSENLEDQEVGIALFKARDLKENERFAILHRDIIARFGRFPHRNIILGRESTEEEIEFLKGPGSSF